MVLEKHFDHGRFVMTQAPVYAKVTSELRAGRKRTHWMWFILLQAAGFGAETIAYLVAVRLIECTSLVLSHLMDRARVFWTTEIHSSIEFVRSVQRPRQRVSEGPQFLGGKPDQATLAIQGWK